MFRRKVLGLVLMTAFALALAPLATTASGGDNDLLVDINFTLSLQEATAKNFKDAGVKEDLAGAQVWNYIAYQVHQDSYFQSWVGDPWLGGAAMRSDGIELTLYNPADHSQRGNRGRRTWCARGVWKYSGTELLCDYLFLYNGLCAHVDLKISGLAGGPGTPGLEEDGYAGLAPNKVYKLYLWGQVGKDMGQNSEFALAAPEGGYTTEWLATGDDEPVVFTFKTGATVQDDIWLGWRTSNGGTGLFGVLNGFAFVEVGDVEPPAADTTEPDAKTPAPAEEEN